MKTLSEVKNEIAQKEGYDNWEDVCALVNEDMEPVIIDYGLVDEVAKLYAEEALKELSERIKDIPKEVRTSKSAIDMSVGRIYTIINELK